GPVGPCLLFPGGVPSVASDCPGALCCHKATVSRLAPVLGPTPRSLSGSGELAGRLDVGPLSLRSSGGFAHQVCGPERLDGCEGFLQQARRYPVRVSAVCLLAAVCVLEVCVPVAPRTPRVAV